MKYCMKNLALSLLLIQTASAQELTLEQYLDQVREGHQGLRAATLSHRSAVTRGDEEEIMTSPMIFANAQWADDKRQNLFFRFPEVRQDQYQLGIQQQTSFGLSHKIYYTFSRYEYPGVGTISPNPGWEGRPMIELSQSLWQNGFGSATRATQTQIRAQNQAEIHAESFKIKVALSDAESSYWRLELARQNVSVSKTALDRAQKILDWAERRSRLQLADRADQLQALSAVKLRKLQLEAATAEERSAARSFNLARGINSDTVSEALPALTKTGFEQLKPPVRAQMRDDVKAAQAGQSAAVANAELAINRASPVFEIFGQASLFARKEALSSTFSNSFKTEQPFWAVGFRFVAPLEFKTVWGVRKGWISEKTAAETAFQRKLQEQENDWKELTEKLVEAKKRLEISREIESAQLEKLNYERDRLTRGRTVTFQVLQFEQEYSQSQLTRIQFQADVLNIIARMKLFAQNSETHSENNGGAQ